jgi:hypothetical protein
VNPSAPDGDVAAKAQECVKQVALGYYFPIALVICQTPMGDSASFQQFGVGHVTQPAVHFEIFAPSQPRFPVDLLPLSDLAIFMNSKV